MKITDGTPYIAQVGEMIREYTGWLGRDLSFQHLEEELADLAGKYTPPEGELLVALEGEEPAGMVAYHRHSRARCEMKRLYVRPQWRGQGVGDLLVEGIIGRAARAGYEEMVLDTLKLMKAAIHLYERAGFRECPPYYHNPMEDVLYFRKELKR